MRRVPRVTNALPPLQSEPADVAPQPTPFHQGPADHHFAAIASRPTNPAYAAAVAEVLPDESDYKPTLAVPRGAQADDISTAPVREATQGNPTFGLDRTLSDPTFALDTALAEISARQKALEDSIDGPFTFEQGVPDPSARFVDRAEPASSDPDLGGLRDAAPPAGHGVASLQLQIAQLSQQIGSLHHTDVSAGAVAALREELAAISRVLTEAVPRRALEALEVGDPRAR